MQNRWDHVMRYFFIFGIMYLLTEFVVHASLVKLTDTVVWPESAIVFASITNRFFAGFALLAAMLLTVASRNIRKYKALFKITAVWAVGYGSYFVYLALTTPLDDIFRLVPSLKLWIPTYNALIFFEGILLFVYAIMIYLWQKQVKE